MHKLQLELVHEEFFKIDASDKFHSIIYFKVIIYASLGGVNAGSISSSIVILTILRKEFLVKRSLGNERRSLRRLRHQPSQIPVPDVQSSLLLGALLYGAQAWVRKARQRDFRGCLSRNRSVSGEGSYCCRGAYARG